MRRATRAANHGDQSPHDVPHATHRADPTVSVIILLADGARPDVLARAMDAGELTALA